MDQFDFLVGLRADIIREIRGVSDAEPSLFWDDTRPNSLTRNRLKALWTKAVIGAEPHGVSVAVRHCDCGEQGHGDTYLMEPIGSGPIEYRDPRFIWQESLGQVMEYRSCPCDGRNRDHYVIYDLIFERRADQEFCRRLGRVFVDLFDAMERSGDKRPRAAIREYLLRALIQLADLILPEPIDDYIARRAEGMS